MVKGLNAPGLPGFGIKILRARLAFHTPSLTWLLYSSSMAGVTPSLNDGSKAGVQAEESDLSLWYATS
jgi:hypothetical protein